MTYNIDNLPQPQTLKKFVGVDVAYNGGTMKLDCMGLSLVRIVQPPEYPDTECLLARVAHEKIEEKTFQTSTFIVPLEYVVKLDLVALPTGLTFLPPSKLMCICPDKPAAKNRLPVTTIKHRLGEFGVAV